METLSRIGLELPSIHENDLTSPMSNTEQRFRPTKKAIEAELSNPESGGVTWEELIERLLEIFDSDEVNIDEVTDINTLHYSSLKHNSSFTFKFQQIF